MAIDLTGIENKNEYFTNHYFAVSFAEDEASAAALTRWEKVSSTGSGIRTPWSHLREDGIAFYTAHEKYQRSGFHMQSLIQIRDMADRYLRSLGYSAGNPQHIPMGEAEEAPVYLEITRENGAPWLWVLLAGDSEDVDLLSSHIVDAADIREEAPGAGTLGVLSETVAEDMVNTIFFGAETEHPRFVLLIGMHQMVLLDRNKWGEKKYFNFDLETIMARREPTTLKAMALLLHKDVLCPGEGKPLLDTLDAESYRKANAVSDDLKYALRESIELLGNEVLHYYRTHDTKVDPETIEADDLSLQCVRYMYRMLFMLFIEARPELGYAPTDVDVYLSTYSLENLRDIADHVRLDIDHVEDSYYIDDTLSLLFDMVYEGYPRSEDALKAYMQQESHHDMFVIHPLKAHIFDREKTKLVRDAHLRDTVMLRIIDLMSLTRDTGSSKNRRGRISYANLGINQLGSVYEALLSYRGFIAKEKLYEVKKAGDTFNELDVGYFIPESEVAQYAEDERVRYDKGERKGQLRTYEKGTFIYRLAGRERESSASYYTPEVLTRCLVKYALQELLKGKSAKEILSITVCEPAMGSAAFLNEAINQLSEAYLEKSQEEEKVIISYKVRAKELQKVKMYIADNNVYGIDLNPTAVELAEVSLWLNTIYAGGYVPWFRTQLIHGNSLIGARRECYDVSLLQAKGKEVKWYETVPRHIPFQERRKVTKEIYHFLLGDPGMSSYGDKVIKAMAPEAIQKIKKWNKAFTCPYDGEDITNLLQLSRIIDDLFEKQVQLKETIEKETADHIAIFPERSDQVQTKTSIREKDAIYEKYYKSENQENAGPYARLKFAMDYWCALWFWPIDKADELPDRKTFLQDMFLILEGVIKTDRGENMLADGYRAPTSLFEGTDAGYIYNPSLFEETEKEDLADRIRDILPKGQGEVDLNQLCILFPRLALARDIAAKEHFMHWELEFADVFKERGGFDLILGNPPWIKVKWEDQNVILDSNPFFIIKKFTKPQILKERSKALENPETRKNYFSDYESTTGTLNFLSATENYPLLKGQQTNLYKCFLPQAWTFASNKGVEAFVHPESIYNDPRGGALRETLFPRLRKHFMFANERKLFPEVDHHTQFSLNVYGGPLRSISFDTISNLYDPVTIEECYTGSRKALLPAIKDENEQWNIKGHPSRIIHVTQNELHIFAKVFDNSLVWKRARLPVLHLQNFLDVLRCFYAMPNTLNDFEKDTFSTCMWEETGSQKKHIIKSQVQFPKNCSQLVLSGSHIGLANPLFKTSRRKCTANSDFDNVDLTGVGKLYLPRCKYTVDSQTNYLAQVPHNQWGEKYSDDYRLVMRKMLNKGGERVLISTIIPPQVGHIDSIFGMEFRNSHNLIDVATTFATVPFDFFVRTLGKDNLRYDLASKLPVLHCTISSKCRYLLLSCLNEYFAPIWSFAWDKNMNDEKWAKSDPRLSNDHFKRLSAQWTWDTPLRSDYARREALVELDVLTAMALGMTVDQLKTIYRIQFAVLQSYEKDTWYDARGRIVHTNNRSMTGIGFSGKEWEMMKDAPAGEVFTRTILDDTMPGGPVERTIEYEAPFDRCDREQDYETVWAYFAKKMSEK